VVNPLPYCLGTHSGFSQVASIIDDDVVVPEDLMNDLQIINIIWGERNFEYIPSTYKGKSWSAWEM